jgi:protein SCO1/2
MLLNGLTQSLKKLTWTPGDQFEVVAVSINPKEKPELAAKKKANYLRVYGRPEAAKGWHFLTSDDESQVKALASQIGFQYRYDEKEKQYAHAAVLTVLTPDARVSRYLYGVQFTSKDLRLSLLEASNGKIGNAVDQVLLFCFHFDPSKNSYSFRIWRVVQIVLGFQVLALIVGLYFLWRKERFTLSQES